MQLLEENSVEASVEKHLPSVETSGLTYRVKVGSERHPMTPEHHIQWIEMLTPSGVQHSCLKPGCEPYAIFHTHEHPLAFRAYCNLHGLWRMEYQPQP